MRICGLYLVTELESKYMGCNGLYTFNQPPSPFQGEFYACKISNILMEFNN